MSAFTDLLHRAIKELYGSRRAFAVAAEPHKDPDNANSAVGMVATGKRPPPLDRINQWADALHLTGQQRQDFIEAAYLAHAPPQVAELVRHLHRTVAALEDRHDQLMAANRQLRRIAETHGWPDLPPDTYDPGASTDAPAPQ